MNTTFRTSEDCIVVSKTLQGIFLELTFGNDWNDEDFVNLYIDEIDVIFPLLERIQSKFGQGLFYLHLPCSQ